MFTVYLLEQKIVPLISFCSGIKVDSKSNRKRSFLLNFGPQHPAAHGVLRLILNLDGEVICNADPHIGLLHRGTEKLIETKTYNKALPYLDRLEYVSTMAQEHAYALLIEYLLNYTPTKSTQLLRIIFSEITRILNHLLAISCHALDVGAMTPFLWAFEDREKLMNFYEQASGARLHAAYIRPTTTAYENEISLSLLEEIYKFTLTFNLRLDSIELMLTNNRIWKQRLVDVGIVSLAQAINWGFSGVMLRGSGVPWDIRQAFPYDSYNNLKFTSYYGHVGDCYDRYLIRILEMRMSNQIISKAIGSYLQTILFNSNTQDNFYKDWKLNYPNKGVTNGIKSSMESLIQHFKFSTESISIPSDDIYFCVEAPKGEFGFYLISNSSNIPYRCKIKAPGFLHLQGLNLLAANSTIADVVTIIGSQDIVFGEIDR